MCFPTTKSLATLFRDTWSTFSIKTLLISLLSLEIWTILIKALWNKNQTLFSTKLYSIAYTYPCFCKRCCSSLTWTMIMSHIWTIHHWVVLLPSVFLPCKLLKMISILTSAFILLSVVVSSLVQTNLTF